MNSLSLSIALIGTALIAASTSSAHEKGNGGDVVRCQPTATSGPRSVAHWRVLDSLVMESSFQIRSFATTEEAMDAIEKQLNATRPHLAIRLQIFRQARVKQTDLERGILWIKGIPKDLQDENLYVEVPKHCAPKPEQSVVRVSAQPLRYYYNPAHFASLEPDRDELSWLLVHEWLREFSNDAELIRIFNGYFHSQNFFSSDENSLANELKALGWDRTEMNGFAYGVLGSPASVYQKADTAIANLLAQWDKDLAELRALKTAIELATPNDRAELMAKFSALAFVPPDRREQMLEVNRRFFGDSRPEFAKRTANLLSEFQKLSTWYNSLPFEWRKKSN